MDAAVRVALALSLASLPAAAQPAETEWGFAMYLLHQDDAYRAIGALKHVAYTASGTELADRANLLIGRLYADRHETQAAVYHLTAVAEAGVGAWNAPAQLLLTEQLCSTPTRMPLCVDELKVASDAWHTGLPAYLSGYYRVLLGQTVDDAFVATVPDALKPKASVLVARSLERQALVLKRPWLAGLLSALLPGHGQAYAGRWVDALVALLVNGGLITATVLLALPPVASLIGAVIVGVVALGFYVAAIFNAVSDAHRTNELLYADFARHLEATLLPRLSVGASETDFAIGYRFGTEPAVRLAPPRTE